MVNVRQSSQIWKIREAENDATSLVRRRWQLEWLFTGADQHADAGQLPSADGDWLQQVQQPVPQHDTRRWRHADHPPRHHTQRTQRG